MADYNEVFVGIDTSKLLFCGFDVTGETAASPVVVVEPVLAFCASAIECAKSAAAATAIMANFMPVPSGETDIKTTA